MTVCTQSCCPGTTRGGGSPALVIGALIAALAVAGPVAAAAASLLHALVLIATVTAAVLAALAVLAVAVAVVRRTRRIPGHRPLVTIPARPQRVHQLPTAAPRLARPAPVHGFELTDAERARCAALGIDPDQAARLIASVLGSLP